MEISTIDVQSLSNQALKELYIQISERTSKMVSEDEQEEKGKLVLFKTNIVMEEIKRRILNDELEPEGVDDLF